MCAMHDRIVHFNNRGVDQLLAGNSDEAISHFRNSLTLLKSAMNPLVPPPPSSSSSSPIVAVHSSSNNNSTNQQGDVRQILGTIHGITTCSTQQPPLTCVNISHQREDDLSRDQTSQLGTSPIPPSYYFPSTVKLEGLQQDSFAYVYSRPFVFFGHLSSPADLDQFIPLHSAVVIFNMALAHHCQGKVMRRRKLLDKAILLYGMCLQILENGGDWQHGIADLVDVAALNNMAQLNFEVGEHYQAQKGVDHLSSLMFGTPCLEILAHYDEEALEGFLLNIILLKPCNVALAA